MNLKNSFESMVPDFWIYLSVKHLLRIVPWLAFVALTIAQETSPVDAALLNLTSQDLNTREGAFSALLAQSGLNAQSEYLIRVRVNSLLRTHPEKAKQIKIALMVALEQQGLAFAKQNQESQEPTTEAFGVAWKALTSAVAVLQDPRAFKGLLLALPADSMDGLADICSVAMDPIINRIHEPDLFLRGAAVGYRRQAITALGWCLERPSMMLLNPDMFDEIRSELLADLNDPDWSVRQHAVDALPAIRTDPEVRARLQIVAATDPYVASGHYSVREAASLMLSSDSFSFYVTRTSDTRLCSVQQTSEVIIVQQFIGPERKAVLKPLMCSHYDPTGQDASLCWKVEPANACSP